VLSSSYVTYSEDAKADELGVDRGIIARYGVVSAETAEAMAAAAKARSGADIAVSVTGYAGPDADEGHEAGEAYIGFAMGDTVGHHDILTSRNDRRWNRNYLLLRMLRAVYLLIR
jgi:nicotinamide-nucleotide amidase